MPLLLFASLIWAASFGLIKTYLPDLDSTAVGTVRIALSMLLFLPFLRPRQIPARSAFIFVAIGTVQFGITYILYLAAFRYLLSYQVALFTIFTPLWLAFFESLALRKLPLKLAFATLLTISGAAVICWKNITPTNDLLIGFVLTQASNFCFAVGQFYYRRYRPSINGNIPDSAFFGYLYIGAFLITLLSSAFATDWTTFQPTSAQWMLLFFLGIVSSGLCFFAWNIGATRVNAATLAAFNNAKIPLAVACSLIIFREPVSLPRLFAGSALLVIAIVIAQKTNSEKVTHSKT